MRSITRSSASQHLLGEQYEEWLDGPLYLDMQPLREQLKPALQIADQMFSPNYQTSATSAHSQSPV